MNDAPSIAAPGSRGLVSPDQRGASGSSQVTLVDRSKNTPLLVLLGVIAGAALGISLWTIYASRETRMLEYYVMELDGKLMAAGLIDYNESWAARKGQKPKEKQK